MSVDPPDVTRAHAEKQGYGFAFLADEKADVIRRWGLLHEGGFRGADISRPAEFLIDPTGIVRWVNLTDDYAQRLDATEALRVIDAAQAEAARELPAPTGPR